MGHDKIDVGYVARLARLQLDDEERARLQKDLEGIVAYVEKIGELDVAGIEPTCHAVAIRNVMRDDAVTASLDRELALANAPESVQEHFKVPRILE